MDYAASVLLLFPAFMIGAVFGILMTLGLAGRSGLKSLRPILFSIAGSLLGILVFLLTQNWWPPVIGPFITCPALACLFAFLGRNNSQRVW
jgi:CHASE2 domain-containing sensor protein